MHKRSKGLGIPYMGSKRKLAPKIINYILKENPNAKYFYDLFGGGGAVSFEAVQRPQFKKVFYNELNSGVVSMLKDIMENGVNEKYYEWISREDFHNYKDGDDWKGGVCKTCWSFGSDQRSYMFSADIENDKRLLHNFVVDNCIESLNEFNSKFNINIRENEGLFIENISQKRLRVAADIRAKLNSRGGELQRLQQLQQLQRLQQLQISNLSYDKVNIETDISETILYLDPPYANTEEYAEKFDIKKMYEYIEKSKYKIYMSGYESHLDSVFEMEHSSSLSATNNNKKVIEKLFLYNPVV